MNEKPGFLARYGLVLAYLVAVALWVGLVVLVRWLATVAYG